MIFFNKNFPNGEHEISQIFADFLWNRSTTVDEDGEETEKFFAIIPGKKEEESDPAAWPPTQKKAFLSSNEKVINLLLPYTYVKKETGEKVFQRDPNTYESIFSLRWKENSINFLYTHIHKMEFFFYVGN